MKRLSHKQRTVVLSLIAFFEGVFVYAFRAWRDIKLQHEWKNNTTAMFLSGIVLVLLAIGFYLLFRALHKELQPHMGKALNVIFWLYRGLAFIGYVIVPLVSDKVFHL